MCSSTAAAKRRSERTAAVSAARPALSHRGSCGHGSAVWTSWCRRRRAGSLRCSSRPPSRPTTSAHPRECCRRSPSPCPSRATEVWCPAPPTPSASFGHALQSVPSCSHVCASRICRIGCTERPLSDAWRWRRVRQIERSRAARTRAESRASTTAPARTISVSRHCKALWLLKSQLQSAHLLGPFLPRVQVVRVVLSGRHAGALVFVALCVCEVAHGEEPLESSPLHDTRFFVRPRIGLAMQILLRQPSNAAPP